MPLSQHRTLGEIYLQSQAGIRVDRRSCVQLIHWAGPESIPSRESQGQMSSSVRAQ